MTDEPEEKENDDDATAADGSEPGTIELVASDTEGPLRLDHFLVGRLAGLSRARIQALIRQGQVEVGPAVTHDPGSKVRPGQRVVVIIPPPEPPGPAGEQLPLTIVYEDKHLLVIDKPAGLVVHPAAGHGRGTLVNALIAHCGDELSGIGGVKRPGIVHRLDKDTSGLLVVAKTDAAHRGLAEQFASHGADGRLVRTYEAYVWGVPSRQGGIIDANLGRSTINRTRMAVMRGTIGRRAVTHYEVVETFNDPENRPVAARLRLQLETGRTHQIRVHLAHLGHPVMGDPVYGAGFKTSANRLAGKASTALAGLGRQALHAQVLGFEHPITGKALSFTSARPADLQALHDGLKASTAVPRGPSKRTAKPKVSKR